MKKHQIVAKLYNRNHQAVQEVPLCAVLLDDGRMSADRYDRLVRQLRKASQPAPKAHYWHLETADGLHDTFGGYPASDSRSFVRFGGEEDAPWHAREKSERLLAEKATKYKVLTDEGEHAGATVRDLVSYAAGKRILAVEKRDPWGTYKLHEGSKLRLLELLGN